MYLCKVSSQTSEEVIGLYRTLRTTWKIEKTRSTRTTSCDKKEELLHCNYYHIKVDRMKNIAQKFLFRKDYHMVLLTVSHDLMQRCCSKTTTTLSMFNKARIEYFGGGIADGHKTNTFFFAVSFTISESIRDKKMSRVYW